MPITETVQHIPLMRRVLVKDVYVAANQFIDTEAGEILFQIVLRFLKQFDD